MRTPLCLLLAGSASLWAADKPAAPRVEAIFPSSHILPANHLKFYIHFSEPMRQGVFLDHCNLLDAQGHAVHEPFRETELWSEDGKRLTLWLHPGKQKTGVNLNTQLGPVLAPGMRCSLVISGAWPSANGVPCGKDTEKAFFTGPREMNQLTLKSWKLTPPPIGSLKPLHIRFPIPLDHALLLRCVRVVGEDGMAITGTPTTTDAERSWRFTPSLRWSNQEYRVLIDSILEDLAGNSLARPFEVDLQGPALPKLPVTIEWRFHVQQNGGS
jgi:hypothetical protein